MYRPRRRVQLIPPLVAHELGSFVPDYTSAYGPYWSLKIHQRVPPVQGRILRATMFTAMGNTPARLLARSLGMPSALRAASGMTPSTRPQPPRETS